tara:strand:- start:166 stop:336 length:171 start_codon:yes stop_codon:yes gene_type:complete
MEDKTKKIINHLEAVWDELTLKYMSMDNKKTSDYFLTLGKASELGEAIDFIKKQYE